MRGGHDIERLVRPRRVALIGSTSKPTGVGSRTLRHLQAHGYPGEILTPSSVEELDGEVDVAVVAVPSAAAYDVVRMLDGRCTFALVNSSGFEEAGGAVLPQLERTTLVGPNSVGLYYAPSHTALTFAAAFEQLSAITSGSGIFMVSQSGAFGARLVQLSDRYGVGFDGFLATGNESYYTAFDVIRDLVGSPECRPRVIGLYLESVKDGAALDAALAEAAAAGVSVAMLLGGTSAYGAAAAASHTAAVSPDHEVVRELCLLHGAFFAESDRDLVESLIGLSLLGRATGERVGIVTGSGGAGVVAADLLAHQGLVVPRLGTPLQAELAALLPAYASTPNPVDITAQVINETGLVADVARLLARSGEIDALVVIGRSEHATAVTSAVGGTVPVTVTVLDGAPSSVAADLAARRPVLPGLAATATALRAVCPPSLRREGQAVGLGLGVAAAKGHSVGTVPDAARSLEAVAAAGVRTARWEMASSPDEAREVAEGLGWPVVLKSNLPAQTHKALHGGVRLDVTRDTIEVAAKKLLQLSAQVVVAEQLRGGPELVAGVRRDAVLGPVVVAGLGGGDVELIGRTVATPISASPGWLAERLTRHVFQRQERYLPLAAMLADVADRLAWLFRCGDYELIECNPLIPYDDRLVALDARVITHD